MLAPHALLGCYELAYVRRMPDGAPSGIIRLLPDSFFTYDSVVYRRVRPSPTGTSLTDFDRTGNWTLDEGEVLRIYTGGGFAGWSFILTRPRPETFGLHYAPMPDWQGTASAWTDTPPIGEWSAEVALTRAPCRD